MKSKTNIDFARLLAWLEGNLRAEEAQLLATQIEQADEETQATFTWLQTFFQTREESTIAAPSPEVHALLTRQFEAYAQARRHPGLIQRLLGTLSFDSKLRPATASFRTAGPDLAPRQLVYSTEALDVTINLQWREDETLSLTGQIFTENEMTSDTFVIQLVQGTREIAITSTDALGEFEFHPIHAGAYDLIVSSDQTEVLIPAIEMAL